MGEFSLFVDGDALEWEKFVPVDRLIDADSAQAVEAVQLDVGGKDMHGVIAVRDWDEEIKDVAFILFISLRCLSSSLPLYIPPVSVLCPVFVGFFQVSHIRLTLCQFCASLLEYFELFLIVVANFLIFSCNSSQSTCNEDEFLRPRGPVSFKSSTYGARRELQLTELHGSGCNGRRD